MEKVKSVLSETKGYIITGMGYMLPVIIVGGLCMAFSTFLPEGQFKAIFSVMADIGLEKYDIFLVIFIANAISKKVSLAPAFFVGIYGNTMGLGIFGALISGLVVGYISRTLTKVKLQESGKAIFSMIVIPFVAAIIGVLVIEFIIHEPVVWATNSLTNMLSGMAGSNAVLLGLILGAMIGFDLGGPINKVAGLFAISMLTEGIYWPMTMATTAYMLPSLGAGLATIINRKKDLFDKDEQLAGKSAFIMGFLLLSEPAIPFMLADVAFMIPCNMIVSALLCGAYAFFGISSTVTLGPIFSFGTTNKPVLAVVLLFVAVILLAFAILYRRKSLLKRGKLDFSYDEVDA